MESGRFGPFLQPYFVEKMKIQKAENTDAKVLTGITMRSKAHWGYSSKQIEKWKDDLTITAEYIDQSEFYTLVFKEQAIGYYSFYVKEAKTIKLDNIFLEPEFIGQGYGKKLMKHFLQKVKEAEYETILLDSEPKTQKFYESFGFKVIGQLESSIKNRFLPIMELKL